MTNSPSAIRLTDAIHDAIYRDFVYTRLRHLHAAPHPRAVLLLGQPGAGQAELEHEARMQLKSQGGACVVSLDTLRALHPAYHTLLQTDPDQAIARVNLDVMRWALQLIEHAAAGKLNVVLDVSMSNERLLPIVLRDLRTRGYAIDAWVPGVDPRLSELALRHELARSELPRSRTSAAALGRHAAEYDAVPALLGRLETRRLVDRVEVRNYQGAVVYENALHNGSWASEPRAVAALQRARSAAWEPSLKLYYATTLDRIAATLRNRLSAELVLKSVERAREHAHLQAHRDPAAVALMSRQLNDIELRSSVRLAAAGAFRALRAEQALPLFPELDSYYLQLERVHSLPLLDERRQNLHRQLAEEVRVRYPKTAPLERPVTLAREVDHPTASREVTADDRSPLSQSVAREIAQAYLAKRGDGLLASEAPVAHFISAAPGVHVDLFVRELGLTDHALTVKSDELRALFPTRPGASPQEDRADLATLLKAVIECAAQRKLDVAVVGTLSAEALLQLREARYRTEALVVGAPTELSKLAAFERVEQVQSRGAAGDGYRSLSYREDVRRAPATVRRIEAERLVDRLVIKDLSAREIYRNEQRGGRWGDVPRGADVLDDEQRRTMAAPERVELVLRWDALVERFAQRDAHPEILHALERLRAAAHLGVHRDPQALLALQGAIDAPRLAASTRWAAAEAMRTLSPGEATEQFPALEPYCRALREGSVERTQREHDAKRLFAQVATRYPAPPTPHRACKRREPTLSR